MKRVIISILLSLLCIIGFSQTSKYRISGLITDEASGESLPGVTVLTGKRTGTISNNYGFYTVIVAEGVNAITYQYMGYKEVTVELHLGKDTVMNIALAQAAMEVDVAVVTARSNRLVSTDNKGGVSVNLQQLKNIPSFLGEQDVFKYLQLLPGVSSGKEGSSGLNIRGGSADQTLILLDDVPIYNQSHAFGFVSTFSGETIKSAELFKGYSSPMSGGRLSGVVSLQTRDGNKYEHKQSVQVGMTTISAHIEGPIKKGHGSYLLSARRFVPDLLLRGYYQITEPDSRLLFTFYDITAKASYDLGHNHSLSLSLYTGGDSFDISEVSATPATSETPKVESNTNIGMDWGNSIASLRWNASLGPKLYMSNTAYYSFLKNETLAAVKDYTTDYKYDSTVESIMSEFGFKSNFDHSITSNYTLHYGANFSKQYFSPQRLYTNINDVASETNYGQCELLTYVIYINNDFNFNKFNLNAGVRFAVYERSNAIIPSLEPRVSLTYNINTKSSAWISYVRNSQPLFSYYSFVPIDNWTPFSGESVPISDQYTVGGRVSIKRALDVTAELYYKNSNNVPLIYNSDDFLREDGGVDIVNGRSYGAEISFQYRIGRSTTMASYNYSRSEYNVRNNWVPFVYETPHEMNILTTYDVIKRRDKTHTFSINVSYKTGLPYILSNEIYPDASSPFSPNGRNYRNITYLPEYSNVRLRNYFRTDINYSMERERKNGTRTWQFSILNITNHTNPYVIIQIMDKYKSYSIIPFMPSVSYKRTF